MAQDSEKKAGTADNRNFKRRSVLWPAKLLVGKHQVACQIWNLSLGGARIRIDLPLRDGTKALLSVAQRGDIPCEVAWSHGETMGLSFDVEAKVIRTMFKDRLHVLGLDADDA